MKKLSVLLTALFLIAGVGQLQAAEWTFDKPHSNIKFKVKHLGVANVWGQFKEFDGSVKYDPANPSEASVNVTIQASSIDTENDKRDDHLRSADFFNVEKFPTLTFTSTKVEKSGDGLKVTGDLTIHGVTKSVTLDVEGPSAPIDFMGTTKVAASAKTTVDRRDFGLTWNKALETGGVLVGHEVEIVIEVELNKQS